MAERGSTSWEHIRLANGETGLVATVSIAPGEGDDVLAHELAHVAQRHRYGPDDEQHGARFVGLETALRGALGSGAADV